MSSVTETTETHNWNSFQWEKFAIKFCGNSEPQGATNYYSKEGSEGCNGRCSLLKDEQKKIIILTFRGSDNKENWRHNFKVGINHLDKIYRYPQPYDQSFKSIELHSGFVSEYSALQKKFTQDDLYNTIYALSHEWRILVTGHSLGGALATLCVADFFLHQTVKVDKIALVTFGSPRVGNTDFAKWIDDAQLCQNIRVEVDGDPVVQLPCQTGEAYTHRGYLTVIQSTQNVFKRISTASKCGEENPFIKVIGNTVIKPISKTIDLFGFSSVSRATSSILGYLGNVVVSTTKSVAKWDFHYLPFVRHNLHGKYYECEDYKQ